MDTTQNPNQVPSKRKSIPLWVGFIAALLVWDVIPWAISLLLPRYGWTDGYPALWNRLGLIPVIVGNIGLFWGVLAHSAQTPMRIDFELDKLYLLTDRLYRYSRNPMYVAELILLFGWIVFYGSVALVIAFVIWYMFFNYYAIPQEERILEEHFGESYREYKTKVPRWFGKIQR